MASWNDLKKHLEYDMRWRPLYTSAFHNLYKTLHVEPYVNNSNLRQDFLRTYDQWLHASHLNQLIGLEAYADRDVIVGVTHSLDDLHFCYKERIVVLADEYKYHHRINPLIKVKEWPDIEASDVLILSYPFSHTGRAPVDYEKIVQHAERVGFDIHIDAAWFGCSRDLKIDLSSHRIKTASFSLSKSLGMGRHRIGVRYARQRHVGPVSVCNDFKYDHDSLMWLGIRFMETFGADYLQKEFYELYKTACKEYGFIETNTIYLAEDPNAEPVKRVGLRGVLRFMREGRY